jgi:anion-transporting  ArsA/GET3 family ATPase
VPVMLDRQMIFVTGKGGVGKSTVAGALGLAAAARGRRTIVCELGAQDRLARSYGRDAAPGEETQLSERLWSTSIDPHEALGEWVTNQVGSRAIARPLMASSTFQYIVAAAPGAREVVSMAKVWELVQSERWRSKAKGYDLAVVDAPASGHGLAMLMTPKTIAAVARVGPIATQATRVRRFLEDPLCSAYVAVALAEEMPVTETLELQSRLKRQLGRELEAVVVNGIYPKRFSGADVERLGSLAGEDGALGRAAARAARFEWRQANGQQAQLRRLRKEADGKVVTLPYLFEPELEVDDLEALAGELGQKLDG